MGLTWLVNKLDIDLSLLARGSPEDPWICYRMLFVEGKGSLEHTAWQAAREDSISALGLTEVFTAALRAQLPQKPDLPRSRSRECQAGGIAVQSPYGWTELRH